MTRAANPAPLIRVVEDESLIRLNAMDMIEGFGFAVLGAGNADEALEFLADRSDIVAVFTDLQMPGSMDGLKLAKTICGRWPPIKILAASGNVDVADDLPEGDDLSESRTPRNKSTRRCTR
jgi:CheY-like chemotaxis protein